MVKAKGVATEKRKLTKKQIVAASKAASVSYWATFSKLQLVGSQFQLPGHEYQVEVLDDDSQFQCSRKATQTTFSESYILKSLHPLIHRRLPHGILYLMPTADDVTDFSASRFLPLIKDNPATIGRFINDTNRANLKRIGNAYLYFRGAKLSQTIESTVKSSTKLKSIPVDGCVFDELDEMDQNAMGLARGRMAHSDIKFEWYLGNPTIPDYGIDRIYERRSDRRVWVIKCQACNTETCLELEFPDCLLRLSDGRVIRACKKCKRPIYPRHGRWVARNPERSKDMTGRWISHLSSIYNDPKTILDEWESPDLKRQNFYNIILGLPYISVENRLDVTKVYATCTMDPMLGSHPGPCAAGMDVGKEFHIVIGFKPTAHTARIVKVCRLTSLNDVYDLFKRFHVKCAVIDALPEQRKVREFIDAVPYEAFACYYQEHQKGDINWRGKEREARVNRTEICDGTHELFTDGKVSLPRRTEEIELYATQMCAIAKILETDEQTGSSVYRYKQLGADHYRHATNYFYMALGRIAVCKHKKYSELPVDAWDAGFKGSGEQEGSWMGC